MKALLKKIWGFRSGTPWKMIVATLYYLMALSVLWFGATTPIPVAAGTRDGIVYGASVFVIFLTMVSPAIFLSDTPIRRTLPLFKENIRSKAVVGMMIVWVVCIYLFAFVDNFHTDAYKQAYTAYNEAMYEAFIEEGSR